MNRNELFSTNKFIQDFCSIADYVGMSKIDFSQAIGLPLGFHTLQTLIEHLKNGQDKPLVFTVNH